MAKEHNSTKFIKDSWIIDTGASNHICTDHVLFEDLITLNSPIIVHLPDGDTNKVTHIGNIYLNNLKLSETLFLPNFSHNVLSVNKLITTNAISCIFYPCFCILQDQRSKKILAVGRVVANLYCLDCFSFLLSFLTILNVFKVALLIVTIDLCILFKCVIILLIYMLGI